MKLRRLLALVLIAVAISGAVWIKMNDWRAASAVSVRFVGLTNDPSLGVCALLLVTNHAVSLIVCTEMGPQVRESGNWVEVKGKSPSGLGYLELGESLFFTVPVPTCDGPWRVPVRWKRAEPGRFEQWMNGLHYRLERAFGAPAGHRDGWLPRARVSYSPEIQR